MAALGFGISVCNVGVNTILQSLTPDRLRGRVISLFTAARFGFDAVGGLIAGFVAAAFGAPATLVGEGVILGVAAAWFLGHRRDIQRASGAAAPSAGRRGG